MRNWKNLRYEKPEALFMPQKKWTVNTFFFSVFLVPLLNIINKKTLHVQHTFFLISKKTTLHVQHTFFLISKKTTLHVQHTFFLISKKTTLHVQHTFLYISLPLFCTTKTSNFFYLPIYAFYGGNVCVPVHSVFSLPLIFTLVAASISHFLTAAI